MALLGYTDWWLRAVSRFCSTASGGEEDARNVRVKGKRRKAISGVVCATSMLRLFNADYRRDEFASEGRGSPSVFWEVGHDHLLNSKKTSRRPARKQQRTSKKTLGLGQCVGNVTNL